MPQYHKSITANQVKYFNEHVLNKARNITLHISYYYRNYRHCALLKFLFQLFFVVPLSADFSNDMLYANNVVATIDISEISTK